jgi:hypothetical protein
MTYTAYDLSGGATEEKRLQNLLATSAGAVIKGMNTGSVTIDLDSLAVGAGQTVVVPVAGVELGDIVVGCAFGLATPGLLATGYVQAAGLVEVRVQNPTTGVVDVASTSLTVLVADIT